METIHPEKVTTDDGTATLRHPLFGDTYHSLHGAATESEHVFIRNGLAAAGRDSVRILEAGFGSGLNAWLTLEYARRHGIRIDYRAVERYPVDAETACGLGYTEDTLFADLHRSAWDRELPLAEGFTLTKYAADLTEPGREWERYTYDLVYFDAFAPATQPEMWTADIFRRIFRILAPGGALVTYSARGTVKQALREAGFTVRRLPTICCGRKSRSSHRQAILPNDRPADTAVRLRRGTRCRRQDDDGADTLPAIRSVGPIARCTAGQGKPAFLCRPFLLRSGCYRYLYYL